MGSQRWNACWRPSVSLPLHPVPLASPWTLTVMESSLLCKYILYIHLQECMKIYMDPLKNNNKTKNIWVATMQAKKRKAHTPWACFAPPWFHPGSMFTWPRSQTVLHRELQCAPWTLLPMAPVSGLWGYVNEFNVSSRWQSISYWKTGLTPELPDKTSLVHFLFRCGLHSHSPVQIRPHLQSVNRSCRCLGLDMLLLPCLKMALDRIGRFSGHCTLLTWSSKSLRLSYRDC